MDGQEKRIYEILGEDDERNAENAERYRQYLLKHLSFPFRVTGAEVFPWEEPYLFGAMGKKKFERKRKTRPSSRDMFEVEGLGPPGKDDDIVAKVRRPADGRRFEIGLSWLSCVEDAGGPRQLLEDYGVWYANY